MLLDKIFRQYDVRGEYPREINEPLAEKIGKATAEYLGNTGKMLVGCDLRPSSNNLKESLILGLNQSGVSTMDVSPCTSDLLTFATKKFKPSMALMVTASHLPLKNNGFKFINAQGTYLAEQEREKVKKILAAGKYSTSSVATNEKVSVLEDYIASMRKLLGASCSTLAGARVVVYPMGGAAVITTPRFLEELGAQVEVIQDAPDDLEPRESNTKLVEDAIKRGGFLLGVINDGDGDRLAARDRNGNYITGDHLLCIFAKEYLRLGGIVVTIDSSSAVFEYLGGDILVGRVGEANYVNDAVKHGAVFGGEPSGHFVDLRFTPSGSGCLFASILAKKALDSDLPQLVHEIPKYYTERIKVECRDRLKTMQKVYERLEADGVEILSKIDGVKYRIGDGTVLIRPSNTESVVRATVESKNPVEMQSILKRVGEMLHAAMS